METRDFFFEVPPEQIAQEPAARREDSRLMVLDRETGRRTQSFVRDIVDFLLPGTVVVVNNTKVEKKRLEGRKAGGGVVEVLLLERRSDGWRGMVGGAGRFRAGMEVVLPEGRIVRLLAPEGRHWRLSIAPEISPDYLQRHGSVPLPPYIKRKPEPGDEERYQTVYAERPGSAAAPTAGLHFTEELLDRIRDKGCRVVSVTLHVGIDTFAPIRSESVEEHKMHGEYYEVPEETAEAVNRAKAEGFPVLALGTTSVRTLEAAAVRASTGQGDKSWRIRPGSDVTELYIYPGYDFKIVDWMFTNFHTPGSSLVVMVSAFAGWQTIRESYAEAIESGFRFFSYGDAMLIR
jgi:S-adenosylmethionine:tRNA ribosyltransferase-isomerase